MTEGIEAHISKSNFYVEYLHWNNNGRLDGFINHSDNMCLYKFSH